MYLESLIEEVFKEQQGPAVLDVADRVDLTMRRPLVTLREQYLGAMGVEAWPLGLQWQRWEEVDRFYRAGARHDIPTHHRSQPLAKETEVQGLHQVPQRSQDSPPRPIRL